MFVQAPMAILMGIEWFRPRCVCWLEVVRVVLEVRPRALRHTEEVVDMIYMEIVYGI